MLQSMLALRGRSGLQGLLVSISQAAKITAHTGTPPMSLASLAHRQDYLPSGLTSVGLASSSPASTPIPLMHCSSSVSTASWLGTPTPLYPSSTSVSLPSLTTTPQARCDNPTAQCRSAPRQPPKITQRMSAWLLEGRRHLHNSTTPTQAGQMGGYLRTGTTLPAAAAETTIPKFLVTGAAGQVGTELVGFLREKVGDANVIASDVKTTKRLLEGPFVYCDVQDKDSLTRIILENGITYVVHLACLLSAVGERNPQLALRINTAGIQNVLDLAMTHSLQVYSPSTIAVFGKSSPKINTPDDCQMVPNTMYGITKVHQELLGQYYADRFQVDYRSLRYPGIISAKAPPGGGTTDYAVEIYHAALASGQYTCYLSEDAALPMMYMPDCLEATYQLMMAPREQLTQTTYNVTAMSFSPSQLADSIRRVLPHFKMHVTPDFRDGIAATWPKSLDDSNARRDWGWRHRYDLDAMTTDMLQYLSAKRQQALKT